MTDINTIAGTVAGFCTTVAFVPQVLRVVKTRHTQDISLAMYAIFVIGIALWIVYGVMIASPPIIITNVITLLLAGAVLVMKIKFG